MGAIKNKLGGGGVGGLLGAAAGLALAPATGGASLTYALGGGLLGSTIGSSMDAQSAAEDAARIQQASASEAIREQQAAREQITQQLAPFREAGVGALGGLTGIAGQPISMEGLPAARLQQLGPLPSVMPGDIGQDSLFQSLKRQAISGIESSAAARGKLMSGSTPQAIAEQVQNLALARAGQIQGMNLAARQQMVGERGQIFGQDIAERQALLGERIAEQERQYQQLFNLAGMGQASAAQQAANIQGSASNIGSLMTQSANAQAAGLVGAANAQAQMYQGLLGAGTTLAAANMLRPQAIAPAAAPAAVAAAPAMAPGIIPSAPLPGLGGIAAPGPVTTPGSSFFGVPMRTPWRGF